MTERHNKKRPGTPAPQRLWLYGRHAVDAAILNNARKIRRITVTKNAADWFEERNGKPLSDATSAHIDDLKPGEIDKLLPANSVHQGLAAEVLDLPRERLKETCAISDGQNRPVIVLDQITDPQNIGAIFRSAAAFGAKAVIVQDRRTPPLSGVLAKAAAGGIETVPCVRAVNIARSLDALKDLGYQCVGLAGDATTTLKALSDDTATNRVPVALVLGAEGSGLRKLVAETCDSLCKIDMAPAMESLNVSNAAAISLYELTRTNTFSSL